MTSIKNIIIYLMLIIYCFMPIQFVFAADEEQIYVNKIDGYVVIKVFKAPPYENDIKLKTFELMKPHFKTDVVKIKVLWQKNMHNYGMDITIAGIYVEDFINKKLSKEELIALFEQTDILPSKKSKNGIKKKSYSSVPVKALLKASELREEGHVYRLNKQYDSAIRLYKQTLKLNPNDIISLFWLGHIFIDQGKFLEAKSYLQQAVKFDPSFKAADNLLFDLNKIKLEERE